MKKFITFFILLYTTTWAQFSGSYNIGTGETYTTLKAAFDAINAGTVTGNVTFYITSDLTESANVGLGVNTSGFSITIRPNQDVARTITFTSTTDNTGPSGHFVIGNPTPTLSWTDATTISTSNITIDGYASGFTTKRLKFTNSSASTANARLITVVGGCDNIVIKNCVFENNSTSATSPVCIVAVARIGTAIDAAPTNLTIENNTMTGTGSNVSMGMRITNSGSATSRVTGFVFKNNTVTARRRLLEINYTTGGNIYNNEFTTIQTGAPGTISYGLWTSANVAGTINIYNNKFLQSSTQETGAFGHRVISLASAATYNIYNNTFAGMEKTAASTAGLNLTYLFFSGVAGTIYHNTFYMPALTNASSTGYYSCIQLSGNTAQIKNNIFISDEATHTNPYFISAVPTPVSDCNNFYMRQSNTNHKVVSTYTTVAAYQSANPTKDINSKSINVTFTTATDLHLSGGSNGDVNLIGETGLSISTDIDGNSRSGTYPYMGADEATTVLPVELTSFTAVISGNRVELLWKTETEVDNYGFEIERSMMITGTWEKIGFVNGAGNSNAPKSYSFTDDMVSGGQYSYRLKQIDRNGNFTYHNRIEVNVNLVAGTYQLMQNYPNPFNPATTIRFSIKNVEQATVKVYDVTGREVTTLFNDIAQAGQVYNVQFNASGFASGMYFYVLHTPNYREVKKMNYTK
ncbi:MAG: T9SS type A sorting domain-containing protein [Bacteroidota bacterium]